MKNIKRIIKSQKVNMGGILLDQPLPISNIEQVDPFLLIHHWHQILPGQQKPSQVGVGPHPHRGFAPVTFIFNGELHHRDSEGYNSVVKAGGTQWMNSGSGIIHSERPTVEMAEKGGEFEIIQFWINAPANRKMDAPHYQPLHASETPVVRSPDDKIKVAIVAGELWGKSSPIETYSDMTILRMDIDVDGEMRLPIPAHYNTLIYLLDGRLTINDNTLVSGKDMVLFDTDGEEIMIRGEEKTKAILLSGEPINEPLATYGPFVMNSQKELMDAIKDYQEGKMGHLNETF